MHSLYQSNKSSTPSSNIYMRHHIHLIFIYYSSFGDRNNYHLLKQQNYRRFLIDSQIVKTTQQFPVFDILFKKISKANSNLINFQDFLKLLPQLSNTIFQQESTQVAFKKFVKTIIKRLQDQIRLNSQFGTDLQTIESTVNNRKRQNEEIQIIKKLEESSIIKKCFQKYVVSTSMHQKSAQDTFQSIYKFLKDFQISPQLVYKSICYVAFVCLLMSKPQNQRNKFQLPYFVQYILVLSEIISSKQYHQENNLCAIGRISKMLQKMQVSAGFQKISKQIKGESYYSMSLVRFILGDHQNSPDKDHCLESLQHSFDKMNPCQHRHKYCSLQLYNSKTANLNSSYESIETLIDSQPTQVKLLKKIFQDLCSYGEVANNKTLKSMKIKKMYNQLGILKSVSQIWLDLMITELVRKSTSGKMEFLQFIQLLNETSKKLQVSKQDMYRLITNQYSSLADNSRLKASKFEVRQDDVQLLMQMLSSISYPLQKIFHFYSKSKNQIGFSQLTKLMYDFEVFPAILTKTKMYQIFVDCVNETNNNRYQKLKSQESNSKYASKQKYATNQTSLKQATMSTLVDQKMLQISCFPLLLLQASDQICDQSLTSCQKLIILIEKMHQSKGQSKVVMGKGTLVTQLRKRYSKIYKMNFSSSKKQETKQTINVDDLLDSISEY